MGKTLQAWKYAWRKKYTLWGKSYWPEKKNVYQEKKLHGEGKIYLAWEKDTERVKQRIRKIERNLDKNKGRYQIERQSIRGL